MYVQIALAVVVLVTIVVAFFAARTWHWGQVLVVLGIVLSTVGFFLLAAETLRMVAENINNNRHRPVMFWT